MAARRTDRWIAVLGAAVLLLGAVVGWLVLADRAGAPWQTPPERRALEQVRERLGPRAEVRLVERGRGAVACGYAGLRGEAEAVVFVSRPNRIVFGDDPRVEELRAMLRADCPNLPARP